MKSVFRTSLFWLIVIFGFAFYIKRFNNGLAQQVSTFLYAQTTQEEKIDKERIEEKLENIEVLLQQIENNIQAEETNQDDQVTQEENQVEIPTQEELNQRRILELEAELESLQNNE